MASHQSQNEQLPRRHPKLLAAALALIVLAATTPGIAARLTSNPTPPSPSAAAYALATAAERPSEAPGGAHVSASGPRSVACGKVRQPECGRIVSGIGSLVGSAALPPIAHVDVYASLLCDSSLDCPPSLLAHVRVLGSAVVSFDGQERQAWVDVVDAGDGRALNPEAWIVRWVDAAKRSVAGA